jgi:acyl phosphate:glycerol-3-phosphate acyltransferase
MFVLLLIAAYFLGAVPFAVLVGRTLRGVDVRRAGSGNSGAMNALRTAGPLTGVLVGVLDAAKAALAVVAGHWLISSEAGALAGCAAVVGHCFSPYLIATSRGLFDHGWKSALRGTGGKGLAAGMGTLLALAWPVAVTAVVVFALVYLVQRKDETWPSVAGSFAAAPAIWVLNKNAIITIAVFLVGTVIAVKHLPDLREAFWVERQE